MPICPRRQQLGVLVGHCADDAHRTTPPAKLQTCAGAQVDAPPRRLRQQKLPVGQAAPSRQPMLAPPGQGAPTSVHIAPPPCWMQQAWVAGWQLVPPHGMGIGGWPPAPGHAPAAGTAPAAAAASATVRAATANRARRAGRPAAAGGAGRPGGAGRAAGRRRPSCRQSRSCRHGQRRLSCRRCRLSRPAGGAHRAGGAGCPATTGGPRGPTAPGNSDRRATDAAANPAGSAPGSARATFAAFAARAGGVAACPGHRTAVVVDRLVQIRRPHAVTSNTAAIE